MNKETFKKKWDVFTRKKLKILLMKDLARVAIMWHKDLDTLIKSEREDRREKDIARVKGEMNKDFTNSWNDACESCIEAIKE